MIHRPDPEEEAFLASYSPSSFERPSLSVDVALIGVVDDTLGTLLYRRSEHPFRGRAALPGGFVRMDESLDAAAARVLREKAGVEGVFLEQLYTFGAPSRDPRTRVVSVAYFALVDGHRFDAIDADKDGRVTRDEIEAARKARASRGHKSRDS